MECVPFIPDLSFLLKPFSGVVDARNFDLLRIPVSHSLGLYGNLSLFILKLSDPYRDFHKGSCEVIIS